jgi:hypothetical protein
MKRMFAILIALALTVGYAVSAGAQAGTANGQMLERYNYQEAQVLGQSISDSLVWSQSTTTVGRHTKTDTLVGTEADTSITVLTIPGAETIAAVLSYKNGIKGATTSTFACTLHTQVSIDGTNWVQVPLGTRVTATSSTTTQNAWAFIWSKNDSLVTEGGGSQRYISGAKFMRFRISQAWGDDTTFMKVTYHVKYQKR